MNVLLVSGDEPFANVLGFGLSLKGMGVIISKSFKEALSIFSSAKDRIDAIVVDYLLEGSKNGLEFVSEIEGSSEKVPKILITPIRDERLMIEAKRVGCNGVLCKPVTIEEIISQLKKN